MVLSLLSLFVNSVTGLDKGFRRNFIAQLLASVDPGGIMVWSPALADLQ